MVAVRAVKRAGEIAEKKVLVLGAGPIGNLVARTAEALGAAADDLFPDLFTGQPRLAGPVRIHNNLAAAGRVVVGHGTAQIIPLFPFAYQADLCRQVVEVKSPAVRRLTVIR